MINIVSSSLQILGGGCTEHLRLDLVYKMHRNVFPMICSYPFATFLKSLLVLWSLRLSN